MKLSYISILICCCITTNVWNLQAQDTAINIGDRVPDFSFPDAWNYGQQKAAPVKLSNLRGKLVILDFWGTFCEPCLEGFPKLDSMQRKFGDSIAVITASPQSKESIDKFFSTHKAVFRPSLPFIFDDKKLEKMFPHTGVPFQVWINGEGKLLYLADTYNFTDDNLRQVIDGVNLNLRQKPKNVYPETVFDKKWVNDVAYASYLVRYKYAKALHLDGPPPGKGITDRGTIVDLYQRLFDRLTNQQYQFYRAGRTVVEMKDSSIWVNKNKGYASFQWMEDHYFEYQLFIPEKDTSNVDRMMLEDLRRYFHWHAVIERRNVLCLALVRLSSEDKLRTKGGVPFYNCQPHQLRSEPTGPVRYMVDQPFEKLADLARSFIETSLKKPFQDFSGYKGNIDFQMTADDLDHLDFARLKKALNSYGLDLVEKEAPLEVLVLSDRTP